MNTTSDLTILHLSLIADVGPLIINKILACNGFQIDQIYYMNSTEIQNKFHLKHNHAEKIFNGLKDKELFNNEIELIEKHNINWASIISDNYPKLLKNIHLPPPIIYWVGADLNDDNDKKIAIVGARLANEYGKAVINQFSKGLVENGWTIVSGGAIGADTMAHQATIDNNGKTIVVLGSGLLKPYPSSNRELFRQIIQKGGSIVSTYPLLMPALAENFPQRNRIISGLSLGCIVIQAAIKSGTRITALQALEQGREVFAVPGRFDDELSSGCHKLIQEGAKLVTNLNDILVEVGQSDMKAQGNIFNEPEPDTLEAKVLAICARPTCTEDIAFNLDLQDTQLQSILFQLQLEGKINQGFTGLWQAL